MRGPLLAVMAAFVVVAVGLGYVVGSLVRTAPTRADSISGAASPAGSDPAVAEAVAGAVGEGAVSGGPCDGRIDGPVELTLSAHSSDEAYTGAVASFNAGPGAELGVTVELLDLDEIDYESFISGASSSSEFPDIVDLDGPFLPAFAEAGLVQPLGSCAAGYDLDDFLPSVRAQGEYRGELFTVASFDSGMGLWAKRSALASVGARVPESSADAWTVAEFEAILRDLSADGNPAPLDIKWWYGAGEWRAYGFAPVIQSAGGDLLTSSQQPTASGAINGPEAVAGLTALQGWVDEGLVDLEAVDDSNFTAGDAAISWVGHWVYNDYRAALGDDLVLVPLPDFGQGSVASMGSWSWGLSATAADPDAVWAFIEHVTSPEQVEVIAGSEGAVPARLSVLDADPAFQPGGDRWLYRQNLEQVPAVARPRPQTVAYGTVRDAFSDAFAEIVLGGDVQEALDGAASAIDRELSAATTDGENE